jgi:hypothetical protein
MVCGIVHVASAQEHSGPVAQVHSLVSATSIEASIRMHGQVEVHAVASEKLFGDREISGYNVPRAQAKIWANFDFCKHA